MSLTIAFDVYGTLINTSGIATALQRHVGESAAEFAKIWRDKQLEYSFRRGLMRKYRDFSVCTRDALDYTCEYMKFTITPSDKDELMAQYRVLPAFPDAIEGLEKLRSSPHRLFAFSNGRKDDVVNLLQTAGIEDSFDGVVSVEGVESFKPNPDVYEYFLSQAKSKAADSWLISGNPFDIIGSISVGMSAAWVKRSAEAVFDPWEIEPTMTVTSLVELADKLAVRGVN
jgi:2-haloacid dehalogenase